MYFHCTYIMNSQISGSMVTYLATIVQFHMLANDLKNKLNNQ